MSEIKEQEIQETEITEVGGIAVEKLVKFLQILLLKELREEERDRQAIAMRQQRK